MPMRPTTDESTGARTAGSVMGDSGGRRAPGFRRIRTQGKLSNYTSYFAGRQVFLQFLDRPRPVVFEQAGERPVGQNFTAGLAAGAVVRFVVGIHDPLNLRAADRARLAEFAVDRHVGTEGGHFLRPAVAGFGPLALQPVTECLLCCKK